MAAPTLAEIRAARARIDRFIVETPLWQWRNREITDIVGHKTAVFLKLELFQHTGTFKPRGALMNMLQLGSAALARGVTAGGEAVCAQALFGSQVNSNARSRANLMAANPRSSRACGA